MDVKLRQCRKGTTGGVRLWLGFLVFLALQGNTFASDSLCVDADGDVCVNGTEASTLLQVGNGDEVSGSSNNGILIDMANTAFLRIDGSRSDSGETSSLQLYNAGSERAKIYIKGDSNALHISTNGADRIMISDSGNLGVGVSVAEERLTVGGAIKIGTTSTANAGTIRWNGTNFQGYKSGWVNLDSADGGDADTLDGLHASQIHDADDYVSNAENSTYATNAGSAADANAVRIVSAVRRPIRRTPPRRPSSSSISANCR